MLDLGALPWSSYSNGWAINESGEVTGGLYNSSYFLHAFLYDGTRMIDLGALPGTETFGKAINARGEVTGEAIENNGGRTQAFLYNGTTIFGLGTPQGFSNSQGFGINDSGEIVGRASDAGGANSIAILYHGTTMFDLNKLIAPIDPLHNRVQFSFAHGINSTGQIVVDGCYNNGPLNGQCHAFRLDPVLFAGTPGKSNCHGQSVSALARNYGGLNGAAAALGYADVSALQSAMMGFCGG